MNAASAKLKIRVTRLYLQRDGTPLQPDMLPSMANGTVLIGSAGPLRASPSFSLRQRNAWRMEGMDPEWAWLLAPHLLPITSTKLALASSTASHMWLAHGRYSVTVQPCTQ